MSSTKTSNGNLSEIQSRYLTSTSVLLASVFEPVTSVYLRFDLVSLALEEVGLFGWAA